MSGATTLIKKRNTMIKPDTVIASIAHAVHLRSSYRYILITTHILIQMVYHKILNIVICRAIINFPRRIDLFDFTLAHDHDAI